MGEIASADMVALSPEHDLDEALSVMAREQVRRLPIVVPEYELVGMLTQADVARAGKDKTTGEMVEAISQPPRRPRSLVKISAVARRRESPSHPTMPKRSPPQGANRAEPPGVGQPDSRVAGCPAGTIAGSARSRSCPKSIAKAATSPPGAYRGSSF